MRQYGRRRGRPILAYGFGRTIRLGWKTLITRPIWYIDCMSRARGILKQAFVLALLAAAPFAIASEKGRLPLLTPAYEIHFDQHLGLRGGLRLRYTNDTHFVDFRCESGSQPVRGSALHLFLEHSPHLNPDRSFLSVSLNYGVLRSLRLDATNQGLTEIMIPLPPNLLHRNNRLILSVEQHYLTGAALGSISTSIPEGQHGFGRSELGLGSAARRLVHVGQRR